MRYLLTAAAISLALPSFTQAQTASTLYVSNGRQLATFDPVGVNIHWMRGGFQLPGYLYTTYINSLCWHPNYGFLAYLGADFAWHSIYSSGGAGFISPRGEIVAVNVKTGIVTPLLTLNDQRDGIFYGNLTVDPTTGLVWTLHGYIDPTDTYERPSWVYVSSVNLETGDFSDMYRLPQPQPDLNFQLGSIPYWLACDGRGQLWLTITVDGTSTLHNVIQNTDQHLSQAVSELTIDVATNRMFAWLYQGGEWCEIDPTSGNVTAVSYSMPPISGPPNVAFGPQSVQ